ncbi:CD4-1 molecule [Sander vitreus]
MKNLIQSVLLLAVLKSTTGAQEFIYYAQVGEMVTLKPPGVYSQKYVYWYFDDFYLAWRNTMGNTWTSQEPRWKDRLSLLSDYSLIIKNLQQEDFTTTFKFKLYGDSSEYTYKLLKLTVNSPSPLLPGDSLSLSCNAETQGPNKSKIHWLNPQGVKMRSEQLHVRATSQDNGEWTCVVTNASQQNVAKVSVTVMDLSPAPLSPQYTSKSRPLTIPCSLPPYISWDQIKAKGIQEVHWQFIPEPGSSPQRLFSLSLEDPLTWQPEQTRGLRPVQDPKKMNLSLTRNRGSEEDRGDYVCALKFKNDVSLNRTVHVKVLQITSSPGTELISGQQLNLTCCLGHPLPSDLRLKWFPPEQSSLSSSSLGSDGHPTHLTIPEVGKGDGGKWRCELWQNDTWLTSAEITLKIEPKLSVWMLVVICSVTVIVILLLVLVFILYQHRQRKMRHLRRRLCQCKTPKPKGFYRT